MVRQQLSKCGGIMEPGDKVLVSNCKDDSCEVMTVIEVLEESVKLKHATIGGYFVISKEHVSIMTS
jgi:anaerobic glycerol-3-phosphate dehydrogenase